VCDLKVTAVAGRVPMDVELSALSAARVLYRNIIAKMVLGL
jgi:hypothetical protein